MFAYYSQHAGNMNLPWWDSDMMSIRIPVLNATTPKPNRTRKLLRILSVIVLTVSLSSGIQSAWIYSKAFIAQILLDQAWHKSLNDKLPNKPWSWADIETVARLDIPSLNKSLIVLNDSSGEAMAFGPGVAGGNLLQSRNSTIAIGGHRDTHLAFLEHLPIGAILNLENVNGEFIRYELVDKVVVNSHTQQLEIAQDSPGLVLITCFPFKASQTGGPLRMIARARKIPG